MKIHHEAPERGDEGGEHRADQQQRRDDRAQQEQQRAEHEQQDQREDQQPVALGRRRARRSPRPRCRRRGCRRTAPARSRSVSMVCRAASEPGVGREDHVDLRDAVALGAGRAPSRRRRSPARSPAPAPASSRVSTWVGLVVPAGKDSPSRSAAAIASGLSRNWSASSSPTLTCRQPGGQDGEQHQRAGDERRRARGDPVADPAPQTVPVDERRCRPRAAPAARRPSGRRARGRPAAPRSTKPAATTMPIAHASPRPRVVGISESSSVSRPRKTVVALASTASAVRRRARAIATLRDAVGLAARRGSGRSAAGRSRCRRRRRARTGCPWSSRPRRRRGPP